MTIKLKHISKEDKLKILLKNANTIGSFPYKYRDLSEQGVIYASLVRGLLKEQGFIDNSNKLLKEIPIDYFISKLRGLGAGKMREIREEKRGFLLKDFTDLQLVSELRLRGYEVSAKKIIEL